jgi:hypothetical protein
VPQRHRRCGIELSKDVLYKRIKQRDERIAGHDVLGLKIRPLKIHVAVVMMLFQLPFLIK